MRIAQLTDLHLRHHLPGTAAVCRRRSRCMPQLLREALHRTAAMDVDLLAVTGDLVDVPQWLTHPVPGFDCDNAESWRAWALDDYRLCRQLLDTSGLRYLVLPGNHDNESLLWQVFDPSEHVIEVAGCRIARFGDREHECHVPRRFIPERERWEAELNACDDRPQVHLQHYVMVPNLSEGYPHNYAESEFLADAMARSPHLRLCLSGHYHAGHETIQRGNTWFATAPAFSDAPFRWRTYVMTDNKVTTHEHELEHSAIVRQGVVFLDRDGVITHSPSFLMQPRCLQLNPGAAAAIRRFNDAGLAVVVISNQTSVGWGLYPESMMDAANDRMCRLLAEEAGACVDAIYAATGAGARAVLPRYVDASRAKPSSVMLHEAVEQLNLELQGAWMVGDNLVDVEAAVAAGVRPMLVRTGNGINAQTEVYAGFPGVPVVDDLAAAADRVLGHVC